ncbi:MAG TPA: hypothetical protein PKK78_06545 [Kouleothrix sp.]|nr:hypothetical protein [Kouleothrix sp.]
MKHRIWITTLLVLVALLALPAQAGAQPRQRCFPETGHCVAGELLAYWERNGGLAVFGYPISDELPNELVEGTWVGRTQWFERDRLELHTLEGVLAGRMGARALELQGRSWYEFPPFAGGLPSGCAYFDQTRHSVCEPFLSYWQRNGGLERFGYPLSEPMTETIGGWTGTVQYFERRRMEHHTELRGTRYEVLLGLLGNDIYAAAPPQLCTTPIAASLQATLAQQAGLAENLGCQTLAVGNAPAAFQPYDNGSMLWVDQGTAGKRIYRIFNSMYAPGHPLTYQIHEDTWTSADPADYGLTPPAGHVAPLRGFGKLWISNKFVRQDMGWPTAAEQPASATVLQFSGGAVALWQQGTSTVYVLWPRDMHVQPLAYR